MNTRHARLPLILIRIALACSILGGANSAVQAQGPDIESLRKAAKEGIADAQYQLGKTLLEQGKTQAAIPHLQAAAKINPDLADVHSQLQIAYRKAGRVSDADHEAKLAAEAKIKTPSKNPPN